MKTILIVDDDVCIGDMLQEVLVKEGYQTARAYSGDGSPPVSVREPPGSDPPGSHAPG